MKVNWILEQFAVEDYFDEVIQVITANGDNYLHLKPFEFYNTDIDEELIANLPTVALCSLQLANEIHRKYIHYVPGAIYYPPVFEVNHYYKNYRQFMLNKDYVCLPYWALKQNKDFIFDTFGNNDCVFIRPNSGGKSFTGFVTDKDRFERDLEQAFLIGENDYELVCISSPHNIRYEWRLVIIDKKIISGSQYKYRGKKNVVAGFPDDVREFAEKVINSVDNPPQVCYTMDIGETMSGLFIIELNSMSCSGLYKCDISSVINNLREFAIKDYLEKTSYDLEN